MWLRKCLLTQDSLAFPLLQLSKAKARRSTFPAAISPTSLLSGGLRGVGERDGSGNRRDSVYRVDRRLPRYRVCSPSLVELEFAGEDLLCGVSVRAVLVRRSCRRRSKIILAHLFFVLAASSSSAYGEVGAFCTGVRAGSSSSSR
jgi:hypothetical protein